MIFIYVVRFFPLKIDERKTKGKHIFHRVFRHLFLEHDELCELAILNVERVLQCN